MLVRSVTGLCLDGRGRLTAVEVVSSLRGLSLRRHGVFRTAPAAAPEASLKALLEEAVRQGFDLTRAVIGLPARSVYQKTLSFPFRGRGKIVQVLPSMLEGEIPFPVDQVAADFFFLPGEGRGSRVAVVACPRVLLDAVLSSMQEGSLPLALQTDAAGLAAAAFQGGMKEGAAVYSGDQGAVTAVFRRGKVASFHHTLAPGEEGDAEVVEILREVLAREDEILLAGPRETRVRLRRILAAAGWNRLREDEDWPLLRGAALDDPGIYMPALGLALAGLGKPAADFDLLRPRRARKEGIAWSGPLARTAVLAGIVFLLGAAGLVADYLSTRAEYRFYSGQLRMGFSSLFPDQKAQDGTETARLTVEIRSLEKKVKELSSAGGEGEDALAVLGELSRLAPEDLDLKVDELTLDPGRLRVDGSLPSFDSLDRLKSSLEASSVFGGIKIQNARVGANASRVSFRIQTEVK